MIQRQSSLATLNTRNCTSACIAKYAIGLWRASPSVPASKLYPIASPRWMVTKTTPRLRQQWQSSTSDNLKEGDSKEAEPAGDAATSGEAQPPPPPPAAPISASPFVEAAKVPPVVPPERKGEEQVPIADKPLPLLSIDAADYPPEFTLRRLLCFSGMVAGYMGLYFTRGSLTYTAPVLVADPSLSITITDIGAMTSAFPLAYGISKFSSGVLGAKFSATKMLAWGLVITALINLAFGFCGHSMVMLTALWFLNGSIQGVGAPASSILLTSWFATKERGTYWGLWNAGANMGGFFTPLLVGYVAKAYGWQFGMWIPGMCGLALGMYTLSVVRDSPEDAGLTPLEDSPSGQALKSKPKKKKSTGDQIMAALMTAVKNRGVQLLALTYFFVYIVRQGATSWLVFYLLQAKGAADSAAAAATVSGLELGGFIGGTLAGWLSDLSIRSAGDKDVGHVGRRVQIVMAYILSTIFILGALRAVPPEAKALQWLCIAALGFSIYGPHMLIGLCGAELVDKPSVGPSQGVLGLVAYIGAANAGIPLSYVVKHYGWDGYFMTLAAAAVVAIALLIPLANAFSHVQLKQKKTV